MAAEVGIQATSEAVFHKGVCLVVAGSLQHRFAWILGVDSSSVSAYANELSRLNNVCGGTWLAHVYLCASVSKEKLPGSQFSGFEIKLTDDWLASCNASSSRRKYLRGRGGMQCAIYGVICNPSSQAAFTFNNQSHAHASERAWAIEYLKPDNRPH